MSSQRVFLVTGANKGIGFEVVKKLSEKQPTDLILLGSRDPKRGEEAFIRLGSPSNVKCLLLDTSSNESIEHAKQEIQEKYGGYIDVLINNAGIGIYELGIEALKSTFNTNFYGVKQMNNSFSPLIRDNGRIVNVSSGLGALATKYCSAELKTKFSNPDITESELEQLIAPLFEAAQKGNDTATVGFNPMIFEKFGGYDVLYYSISKLALNTLTRIEARDWNKKYTAKNVIISSVCPGFCATDINGHAKAARPAELGADSILHVVFTENLENGQFWKDGKLFSFE